VYCDTQVFLKILILYRCENICK